MRPAWSIIVFTSLSGLGLGLLFWFGLGFVAINEPIDVILFTVLGVMAVSVGLMSSLLHLGHPERAWRALSQWRSSWLSREGVCAVATILCTLIYSVVWYIDGERPSTLGLIVATLSLVTVWTTAMIYASLRTVLRWYHPLTPWVYLALSVCGGLLALNAWEQVIVGQSSLTEITTIGLVIAFAVKLIWWKRAGNQQSESTPETATGLGSLGQVDLLMSPHTEENWLQHEMGFVVARRHIHRLSQIAVALAFVLPLAALWSGVSWLIVLIPVIHFAGILIERWLFFAEAKHVVTLFYGERH